MHKALFAFVLLCVHGSTLASPDRIGIPDNGVELGLGWDSQQARIIHNRCILFAPVHEAGQSIRMELHDVSDTSEVMDSLGVSASMSVKTLAGSGSAQASFARKSKVSTSKSSLLIRATVDNGVLFAAPSYPPEVSRYAHAQPGEEFREPESNWWAQDHRDELSHMIRLTEEAAELLGDGSNEEVRAFERHCGDSFVSAIYSGAELIAVASKTSTDSSSSKDFRSSMRADFSAWGAKLKASTDTSGSQSKHDIKTSADIQFTQIGGRGGIIPTNAQEFMDKVQQLPLEAEKGPHFHSMEVTPYHDLPLWPASLPLQVDDDPAQATLINYYWTMQSIEQQIDDLLLTEKCVRKDNNPCASKTAALSDELPQNLKDFQDALIAKRGEILLVLRDAQAISGLSADKSCCFGLINWQDKTLKRRLDSVRQAEQEMLDTLKQLTLGTSNPNLLRLHLPLGDGTRDAESVVTSYLKSGAARACIRDPGSSECLNNAQLHALQSCLPETPGKWDIVETCKTELPLIRDGKKLPDEANAAAVSEPMPAVNKANSPTS